MVVTAVGSEAVEPAAGTEGAAVAWVAMVAQAELAGKSRSAAA